MERLTPTAEAQPAPASYRENGITIAYRHSNDAVDEDWQLGTVEDAVELALEYDDTYRQQVS